VQSLIPFWLLQRKDLKQKFRKLLFGVLKTPAISFRWKGRMKPQKSFSIFLEMKTSFNKSGRPNNPAAAMSRRDF
jgi:hypothetical protein